MLGSDNGKGRAGISAQTSVEEAVATTGGRGECISRVASDCTSAGTGAGSSSCNTTATIRSCDARVSVDPGRNSNNNASMLQRSDAIVSVDSDHESVASINTADEESLLRSPGEAAKASSIMEKRPKAKPNKEGLKAKAQYKAAIKLCARLENRTDLSKEEKDRLVWAKDKVEEGRAYFSDKKWCETSDTKFANRIEEQLASKRQRSTECEGPSGKRLKQKDDATNYIKPRTTAGNTKEPEASTSKAAMAEMVAKRHLIVALVDHSNPLGQMSLDNWKVVEMKLLDAMIAKMDAEPDSPMPSFDGAGWFSGVKILKCMDEPTLKWLRETVKALQGLWEGASLEVVDRSSIPALPKAKVLIPRVVKPENALRLLQRQNPDVPTGDWRVLKVTKPVKGEGQIYILQINKLAEDILYPRFGKMSWGVGSVYLRLKKRHPKDKNHNTLAAEEIEKDLGLEEILISSLNLRGGEDAGATAMETNPAVEPKANAEGFTN